MKRSEQEPADLVDVARAYCRAKRLEYVREVGAGSFKKTFEITGPDGQSQALKIFQPAACSPERTAREVAAMIQCAHANIARLIAVEKHRHAGKKYDLLREEFLPGGTLSNRLQRGTLPRTEVLRLGTALISAVAHIASHNLVHRDLKPDNIMFRADGVTPCVVDFGLVRDLSQSSLTQTWQMRGPGTPLYASPEQLTNEKALIDWRADQFSLGVVLSYAAVAYHPYANSGEDAPVYVERVGRRGAPAVRFGAAMKNLGLTPLERMVKPWPVGRFRTPRDLSDAWQALS